MEGVDLVDRELLAALVNTEQALARAAEIDPEAWAAPLPRRMQARRERSYKAALQEVVAKIGTV